MSMKIPTTTKESRKESKPFIAAPPRADLGPPITVLWIAIDMANDYDADATELLETYDFLMKYIIIAVEQVKQGRGSHVCFTSSSITPNSEARRETDKTAGTHDTTVRSHAVVHEAQLWDTAGQERFRSVTRSYYRGAAGAILVYDITSRASFLNLSRWLADARALGSPQLVTVLVGNKSDREEDREVEWAEASRWAAENDVHFLEASSLTGDNVEAPFLLCARSILLAIESGALDPEKAGSGVSYGDPPGISSDAVTHTLPSSTSLGTQSQVLIKDTSTVLSVVSPASRQSGPPSAVVVTGSVSVERSSSATPSRSSAQSAAGESNVAFPHSIAASQTIVPHKSSNAVLLSSASRVRSAESSSPALRQNNPPSASSSSPATGLHLSQSSFVHPVETDQVSASQPVRSVSPLAAVPPVEPDGPLSPTSVVAHFSSPRNVTSIAPVSEFEAPSAAPASATPRVSLSSSVKVSSVSIETSRQPVAPVPSVLSVAR
ncbi:hypothetical protein NM688_g8651 [Phlebia brevispora]|uniref:Uncharacterized protein n=1 Tax=Phlebia brevispora TaxID=194682 RepID=A0ACC1RPM9_9APHY|nr:hypothetical protein NM688_g8651 [Phlebia brevispora]